MELEEVNETGPVLNRIIREPERREITGISRVQWWRLEKKGQVPKRVRLGENSVGWQLSELLDWVRSRPKVS